VEIGKLTPKMKFGGYFLPAKRLFKSFLLLFWINLHSPALPSLDGESQRFDKDYSDGGYSNDIVHWKGN